MTDDDVERRRVQVLEDIAQFVGVDGRDYELQEGDVDVFSSVVTVADGEDGPEEPAPPEDYEFGPEVGVPSDAVTAHALAPTDGEEG